MNYTGFPTIAIDASKCTIPFACKKCLEVCPQAVFVTFGIKHERGREIDPNDPGAYGLAVAFQDKCTGCDDCIEVCPEGAITINFPEMEA